ncbi:MAG: glycoside hydrolase family 30 beta sandwich domain-containing protein [Acidobacteriaceae bacterium]
MCKKRFVVVLLSVFAVVVGVVRSLRAQTVNVVETTGTQSALLAQEPSVSFGAATGGTYTITINPATQYQQMDGFGAAMTDSSAYNIYHYLTPTQQTALMQSLFSSTQGIGLTMLRQPMGASDFSAQGNFSYDDMPAGETDVPLANFSIAKDLSYTIPVLKQAFAINPKIKVEMLPWSPPAWMKLSGTMNGGNFNDTYMPSLAQYFVKTIQAYQAQGIPVYAIAAQNEPLNSSTSYPTESFSASEESTFIVNDLGPALASAGLTPKIFGYEHNWNDTSYPETILANAGSFVAGTSWHCYDGQVSAQSEVEAAYPSYGAWFTECSGETTGTFNGDLGWGMENLIIGATRNYAKSVSEWNIALDQNSGPTNGGCTDCYGFVTINTSVTPATVTPTTSYYLYGQANGVIPGAYRVESNSAAIGAGGIEDVAFQNPDGSMVLIVYNDGSAASTFDVNWAPNNTNFTYTLSGQSAATFYWNPAASAGTSAPTNLTATAVSSSEINLAWTASSTPGATYSIYRSTTSGFTPSSSNLLTSGLSGTSYSNTGLTAGTTYYYLVEAVSSSATSGPSNQASATTATASPNFSLSGTAITIATQGTSGTGTITVTATGGFSGSVTLSCAVTSSPAGASDVPTCSVTTPVSVSGSSPGEATLTVNTTAQTAKSLKFERPDHRKFDGLPEGGVVVAALLLFGMPIGWRRWNRRVVLLLLLSIGSMMVGCNSGSSPAMTTPSGGTTTGAYVLTVTGASGSLTASTTVSLTVN